MKNIHLIPTGKASRLVKIKDNLSYTTTENIPGGVYQNIYITSDEEIKEGDYFIAYSVTSDKKPYISCASEYKERKKEKSKIILTNDKDLIKDGVQAIDDEFLEWFVKNPSCEEVVVGHGFIKLTKTDNKGYWISIPDEEFNMKKEEPKQETLKEVKPKDIQRIIASTNAQTASIEILQLLKEHQAKTMYSEEEVLNLLIECAHFYNMDEDYKIKNDNVKEWFSYRKKI